MRKSLLVSLALGLLIAVSVAGIATAGRKGTPVKVISGNVELIANGGVNPSTVSKTKPTPISLWLEGKINTLNGEHPPALKEVVVETDKNGAINVAGYPVCQPGKLQATTTKQAEKNCPTSIVGTGETDIQILFEESKQIPVHSKLVVFNGGKSGATTTLFIHAYITFPVPAAVVTTVKIKKIHHGQFGLRSVASIPKIAGGTGSVTSFELEIKKTLHYKNKTFHILTLTCPKGQIAVHAEAAFLSGSTNISTDIPRPCTGKK